jgi:hypothetical protein
MKKGPRFLDLIHWLCIFSLKAEVSTAGECIVTWES